MTSSRRQLPSVDAVLRMPALEPALREHGHAALADAVRAVLKQLRDDQGKAAEIDAVIAGVVSLLDRRTQTNLRRVHNLTGTVLHTNLGRAVMSEAAIAAVGDAMRNPCALEFDLHGGGRGDRDTVVEG
ncbi:MAG: hypothetical protein ACKOPO_05415, partial [Novosphingobium sp.]